MKVCDEVSWIDLREQHGHIRPPATFRGSTAAHQAARIETPVLDGAEESRGRVVIVQDYEILLAIGIFKRSVMLQTGTRVLSGLAYIVIVSSGLRIDVVGRLGSQ